MAHVTRLKILTIGFCVLLIEILGGTDLRASNLRLHSITTLVSYNLALNLKEGQNLKSIAGPGAGASFRFTLSSNWNATLNSGYIELNIDQPDPIPYWNWEFWNRFYGNYIRDLQRDSNYVAQLSYRQKLSLIPAVLLLGYSRPLGKRFTLTLQLGGGIYLFKRTLAVHEKWSKYFPEKNYSFTYAFDNHANPHSGKVPVAVLGLESNFRCKENLHLNLGLKLLQCFNTEKEHYFPFKQLFQFQIGLQFLH